MIKRLNQFHKKTFLDYNAQERSFVLSHNEKQAIHIHLIYVPHKNMIILKYQSC